MRGSPSGLRGCPVKRPSAFRTVADASSSRALPNTIARARFPAPRRPGGECGFSEDLQALPSHPGVGGSMGAPNRGAYDTPGPLCPRPAGSDPAQGLAVGRKSLRGLEIRDSHTRELSLSCPSPGHRSVSTRALAPGRQAVVARSSAGKPETLFPLGKINNFWPLGTCSALAWPRAFPVPRTRSATLEGVWEIRIGRRIGL